MSNVQQASPSIWSYTKALTLSGIVTGASVWAYTKRKEIKEFADSQFIEINNNFGKLRTTVGSLSNDIVVSATAHQNEIGIAAVGTLASCLVIFRGKHPKATLGITATVTAAAATLATLKDYLAELQKDEAEWKKLTTKIDEYTGAVSTNVKNAIETVRTFLTSDSFKQNALPYAAGALASAGAAYGAWKVVKWMNQPSGFQVQLAKAKGGDLEALKKITNLKYLKARSYNNQKEVLELLKAALPSDKDGSYKAVLGCMYYYGYGTPVDVASSNEYFFKAARSGNADALFNLGVSYERGEEVIKDSKTAFEFYRGGAEKGSYYAMSRLIYCYDKGFGVALDGIQANYWRQQIVKGHSAPSA